MASFKTIESRTRKVSTKKGAPSSFLLSVISVHCRLCMSKKDETVSGCVLSPL